MPRYVTDKTLLKWHEQACHDDEENAATSIPFEELGAGANVPEVPDFLTWLSPGDVAEKLGCGVQSVRTWIAKGMLPAIHTGKARGLPSYWVKPEDFEKFKATYHPRRKRKGRRAAVAHAPKPSESNS